MEKETCDNAERVICHIKALITSGVVAPGQKLPSERKLSDLLKVSRIHVREAFKKLEAYGIVKTYPQSGTVVSQMKMQILESLITDMLTIDQYDFPSLVHVRVLLEIESAKLCAVNRTEEDLINIENALSESEKAFYTDEKVKKDLEFHHAIAIGSHNSVIASLLLIITPDVLKYYNRYKICDVPAEDVFDEHRNLLKYIKEKNPDLAAKVLAKHFRNLVQFSKQVKGIFDFGNI